MDELESERCDSLEEREMLLSMSISQFWLEDREIFWGEKRKFLLEVFQEIEEVS